MSKKVLSISVSNYCVRVVSGVRRKSAFEAQKSYVFCLPSELQGENNTGEKVAAALGAFLKQRLKAKGIKRRRAVFSVSTAKTVSKNVTLPKMKAKRLDEAVMLNAAEWFPVDLKQYRVVYSIANVEPDGSYRLQVYAIPKNLVDNYTTIASAAGLRLVSIDYAPNSRINFYRSLKRSGTVVYAHVEDYMTSVVVLRDGVEQFFRTLLFGASDLVNELLEQRGAETPDEAEGADDTRYYDAALALTENYDTNDITKENAASLLLRVASGIGHSVRYFIGNSGGEPDAVVLDGPYRNLWQLRECVAAEVTCPVTTLEDIPQAYSFLNDLMAFTTELGAPVSPLNILASHDTKEVRRQRALEKKLKAQHSIAGAIVILVIALLACALLDGFLMFDMDDASLERDRKLSLRDELLYVQAAYDESTAFGVYLSDTRAVDEQTAEPNENLKAVFEELEAKLPDVSILEFAACTAEGITFNFKVPDIDDAAHVIMQLRTFESFRVVDVRGLKGEEEALAVPGITFTASCLYNGAAESQETAPTSDELIEQDAEAAQEGELQ